ncbi:unnamed protein product [Linum tenue]|uniref:Pentatricopeptide repeat-containing protein n=1 Tax=Linum tenue TaxID=586396 RepID=A0AAV0HBW6_9ROSI|nr:unnamed protein product [Linum tenue]
MNRARLILSAVKLSRIACSTRLPPATRVPLLSQVTSFSQISQSKSHFFHANQRRCFSSSPNSVVELLLGNDWSTELSNQLENNPFLITHETVVYILRKLDHAPDKAWGFYNWVTTRDGFVPSSSLYSLLLRIFADKDSMKKFWITLRKMKEQGFCLDEETYTTLWRLFKKDQMQSDAVALKQFYDRMIQENAMDGVVKKVAGVILEAEWGDEVMKRLEDMKIVLSDNFVIRVLRELKNRPFKALSFFHWVATCEGYKHSTVTYNAMARVLGKEDTMGEFWIIVEEMKSAGYYIDIDSYIKISRHFHKYKMNEESVKFYEFMMDSPFKPSTQDCSLLLRNMSASHKLDLSLVFRVVKKYEATGNVLSKAIYDGLHRSLVNAGSFAEADKILNAMRDAGCEPDNITYSQLVFGLCKAGRFEEASKVLDDMEANGCPPDIKTWTILIQGHCNAGQLEKALMCFGTMMRKDGNVDADLVDVLVKGFVDQKKIDGGYTFLVEMINNTHVRPWQATYKLIIESLLGASKLEESMNVLRLMRQHNYPPYPEPFVQYISKYGTVLAAADLLQALSSKQYPSLAAYKNVFEAFFKEGRHAEAQDLLYKCPYHVREHYQIGKLFGSAKNGEAATLANKTVT